MVDREQAAIEVTVDARDLSSGVYLYRLESGSRAVTRKLLLVR